LGKITKKERSYSFSLFFLYVDLLLERGMVHSKVSGQQLVTSGL